MNRLTKLIHRVEFSTRQRRAVSHFKKYVISQEDVAKDKLKSKNMTRANSFVDISAENRKLLKRFDPEDDRWDRRALFEVTGIRLHDNDFLESDTSDEET